VPRFGILLHSGGCGGELQVNPDLRNLIALQDIDTKIVTLKKQISDIPEKTVAYREEFQQLDHTHQKRVALSQDLAKQRRTREGDVDMMRTKLSRLKEQLMAVKTNKEYTAMLHEIQSAESQIRAAEDGILEIMEKMESLEGILAQEEKELRSRQAALESQIRKAEEAVPMLEAEVARLFQEKTELERRVQNDLLARYRRIGDARKGIALAEAKDELCSACHVRIRPQVLADLIRTEEIHVCDSCSRILFFREGS
jgi:predicted  nucleic acid-binding Zn-ribbon protein